MFYQNQLFSPEPWLWSIHSFLPSWLCSQYLLLSLNSCWRWACRVQIQRSQYTLTSADSAKLWHHPRRRCRAWCFATARRSSPCWWSSQIEGSSCQQRLQFGLSSPISGLALATRRWTHLFSSAHPYLANWYIQKWAPLFIWEHHLAEKPPTNRR